MTGPLILAVVALLLAQLLVTFLVAFSPTPSEWRHRTKSAVFAVGTFIFFLTVCCLGVL